MQKKLTEREEDVYVFYVRFIEDNGMSPMLREASEALGISPQMISKTLRGLQCKKFVKIIKGKNRNIKLIPEDKPEKKSFIKKIFQKG